MYFIQGVTIPRSNFPRGIIGENSPGQSSEEGGQFDVGGIFPGGDLPGGNSPVTVTSKIAPVEEIFW